MSNPFSSFAASNNLPSNPFAFFKKEEAAQPAPVVVEQPAPTKDHANPFAAFVDTKVELPEAPKREYVPTSQDDFSFGEIDHEIRTIEHEKKRQAMEEALDMQNAIQDAVKKGSYIALPIQSDKSKQLADFIAQSAAGMGGKKGNKNAKGKKNSRAARVAESKLEQLEARISGTGSYKKSQQKNKKKQRKNLSW